MQPTYLSSMTKSDLDQIMVLEQLAHAFPWSYGHFEDALASGNWGLCLRDSEQQLLGYGLFMSVVDEIHLLNLCIAPFAQGKGFALKLLKEAVRLGYADKFTSMLLEVRASNQRALHLYERFGFSMIGRRKNYYPAYHGSREDGIVMRLELVQGFPSALAPPCRTL